MRSAGGKRPPAVVVGLDCITGLQTARILAGRGVPVIGVAADPKHFACRTRVCQEIMTAATTNDAFIGLLERLGPTLPDKGVLFPCTDMSVLLISRHRRRLEPWYHVVLPAPEVVEMLMDKISFYTFAPAAGLPIPATFLLRDRATAVQAANALAFPCILKPPVKTPLWQQHNKVKAYKVGSPAELLELYGRCAPWAEVLIAQEWIPGDESHLYSCNCYYDAAGEPLVTFIARKIRQWPPQTGTSCLGEEVRDDNVLDGARQLFGSVAYQGLGYVEMKRDERSGRYTIIEPNIGRPTGRSAIAEAGGVELLYTMYCDALGRPLPAARRQTYGGVKWIYWRHDLQSAWHYFRRGELTLAEWWRSWQGKKGTAVFSWRDPLPFWADVVQSAGLLLGLKKSKRPVAGKATADSREETPDVLQPASGTTKIGAD